MKSARNYQKIILLSSLLFTTIFASAQIPDNANVIIITNSHEDLFALVIQTLNLEGYQVIASDNKTGYISTGDRGIKSGSIRLSIMVQDTSVTVRGSAQISLSSSPLTVIQNKGMKGSHARMAWEEMDRVALLLGNAPVYLRM